MKILTILLCFGVINHHGQIVNCQIIRLPEDGRLNFTGLARKYGQVTEEYDVTTPDGYILRVHRIVGEHRRPVLLVHGAIISSDSFLLRGETSIGIILANKGYDVWALNLRGNKYTRRHLTLNADTDKEFWDFSVHEYGYHDVPSVIDFVLKVTGQQKLSIIGYSAGNTAVFVMGAIRPEYNDKISVYVSLAPVHIMQNSRPLISTAMKYSQLAYEILVQINQAEFMGYYSTFKQFWDIICSVKSTGFQLCLVDFLYQLSGIDIDEIEEDFFPVIVGHFPEGTSSKNINHLAQIGNRKMFGQYDYGTEKNNLVYGTKSPPLYNTKNITMPVALFVGLNDRIATVEDVALLRKELPHVVLYHEMQRPQFNHLDFIWGRNAHKILYPLVLDTLEKYG